MRSAPRSVVNPATIELLKCQTRARFTRMFASFRNPRRKMVAAVAVFLGFIWTSQATLAILFRESARLEDLRNWIPLGLLVYAVWHIFKTITNPPEEPFEWTGAEKEWLQAAPVSRSQLITYRLIAIFYAAVAKAACFSLVMIPDIPIWINGFVGMLLALVFVDLIRVCAELFWFSLARKGQLVLRTLGVGMMTGMAIYVLVRCLIADRSAQQLSSPAALLLMQSLLHEVVALSTTMVGQGLRIPFEPFANVVLAPRLDASYLMGLASSMAITALMILSTFHLDRWMLGRGKRQERQRLARPRQKKSQNRVRFATWLWSKRTTKRLSSEQIPPRLGGAGSLLWRQLLGAWHYRSTLVVSLGAPILLCCIPLLANHSPFVMLLNVVGGIVFYSFLLLPSALMLDFRRDIGRLVVLKSLPIGPWAVTAGQLAAPVLVCWGFQWTVLCIAVVSGSVVAWQAIGAGFLLLPINTLIFAMENYIFLVAPYRRNQEGVDVFLRTILTFTAKGILFAIAMALTLAWAFAANSLGEAISIWGGQSTLLTPTIFGLGVWGGACGTAWFFVAAIVRLYQRFDPSLDVPANS